MKSSNKAITIEDVFVCVIKGEEIGVNLSIHGMDNVENIEDLLLDFVVANHLTFFNINKKLPLIRDFLQSKYNIYTTVFVEFHLI